MANIIIRDLTESMELDHAAMLAILGGSRMPGRQTLSEVTDQYERLYRYPELTAYYQRIAMQGGLRSR